METNNQIASPVLTSHWHTPAFIAQQYGRSLRLVQMWCNDGTMIDFGFIIYQDHRRRWWIKELDNTL